jgi:hypothetical protein
MFRWRFLTAAVAAAVVALASPTTGRAAFTITLSATGYEDIVITDGVASGSNGDTASETGSIQWNNGSVFGGYYKINVTADQIAGDLPLYGYAGQIQTITTTVEKLKDGSAPVLTIKVHDTAFDLAGTKYFLQNELTGTVTSASGSVAAKSFIESDETALAYVNKTQSSDTTDKSVDVTANPFSLGNVMTISSLGDKGTASVTLTTTAVADPGVNPVPAPTGLIMAVTAVPFFGLIRRRLRQTTAPTA